MSETPKSSNASLIGGLAAAVVLALGVGVLVYRQPAATPASPAPVPSPSVAAEASPAPEASPDATASPDASAPVAAAPGSAPSSGKTSGGGASNSGAKPTAGAGQAASGKGATTGKAADKGSLGGPRGTAGAPPPLTSQAMMRRTFVASRTTSESVKGVSKTLSGFDGKKGSKDVQVKRAPEIDGRIEFSSTPQRVKPGDKYKIRVAFVNEGKRTIEIKELVVTTKVNGKENREALKPLTREVESRQNEILYEIAGTWDKTTATWSVEAEVLSTRLDTYRNQVVWK